jgi:hypothetical protein
VNLRKDHYRAKRLSVASGEPPRRMSDRSDPPRCRRYGGGSLVRLSDSDQSWLSSRDCSIVVRIGVWSAGAVRIGHETAIRSIHFYPYRDGQKDLVSMPGRASGRILSVGRR